MTRNTHPSTVEEHGWKPISEIILTVVSKWICYSQWLYNSYSVYLAIYIMLSTLFNVCFYVMTGSLSACWGLLCQNNISVQMSSTPVPPGKKERSWSQLHCQLVLRADPQYTELMCLPRTRYCQLGGDELRVWEKMPADAETPYCCWFSETMPKVYIYCKNFSRRYLILKI